MPNPYVTPFISPQARSAAQNYGQYHAQRGSRYGSGAGMAGRGNGAPNYTQPQHTYQWPQQNNPNIPQQYQTYVNNYWQQHGAQGNQLQTGMPSTYASQPQNATHGPSYLGPPAQRGPGYLGPPVQPGVTPIGNQQMIDNYPVSTFSNSQWRPTGPTAQPSWIPASINWNNLPYAMQSTIAGLTPEQFYGIQMQPQNFPQIMNWYGQYQNAAANGQLSPTWTPTGWPGTPNATPNATPTYSSPYSSNNQYAAEKPTRTRLTYNPLEYGGTLGI